MAKQILKLGSDYNGQILGVRELENGDFEVSPIEINADGYLIVDASQAPISGIDRDGEIEQLIVDYRGYLVPIDYFARHCSSACDVHNIAHVSWSCY